MDVIFGPEYKPKVKVGDKVAAGTSVLAVPVGVMQGALPDNSR
jgi:hypothetical protein